MAIHHVKLKNRGEVAQDTFAFHFEKPSGFEFKPGQFITLTLIDPPETDDKGNTRAFSIASACYEADLIITTRTRDTAFKRVLKTMQLGTEVKLNGPLGKLTLHEDARRPAVFLAGGIGITPFRSILLEAAQRRLSNPLFLFYTNRRYEDAAFIQELSELETRNPAYKFIGSLTKPEQSNHPWQGATGYINKEMLERAVGDLTAPIYYIAGPAAMVTGMQNMLNDAGVSNDNIHVERFAGY